MTILYACCGKVVESMISKYSTEKNNKAESVLVKTVRARWTTWQSDYLKDFLYILQTNPKSYICIYILCIYLIHTFTSYLC